MLCETHTVDRRQVFEIATSEFQEIRDVQIRLRWDWPATFSTNKHGQIWPFATYGYTHNSERLHLRRFCPVLDAIADEYLWLRPEGGRFFVGNEGAFFRDPETKRHVQFVEFRITMRGDGGRRRAAWQTRERSEEVRERHEDAVFALRRRCGLGQAGRELGSKENARTGDRSCNHTLS